MSSRLTGAKITYQHFPPIPELRVNPSPIKEGIYGFSSTGFTVMSHLPKKPSEIVAIITEQYEEKEYDRFGREVRGGPGKSKGKAFFRAHLTWYGIEYSEDNTKDELEEALWALMSMRPLPTIAQELFAIEAKLRKAWLGHAAVRQERVIENLLNQGLTAQTSDILAELTGADSLTDDFFEDPQTFFHTHFPPGVSNNHVVVLMNFDTNAEVEIYEWACDRFSLVVEKVENNRGRARDRGRFPDFVVGKDLRAVSAKADDMRRENGLEGERFRPY